MGHRPRPPHQTDMKPDLDQWLPDPGLQVAHRREARAPAEQLWESAKRLRVGETAMLGRLIRWRIPGITAEVSFDELFQNPPFILLDGDVEDAMVSGLVGRIWTLRRDYPRLSGPEEFRAWSQRGTARVLFANWIEAGGDGRSALVSETRVEAVGTQGRIGVAAVRPLVRSFHNLVGSDGIEAAVRRAERESTGARAKH
jgi:hypothetical protein